MSLTDLPRTRKAATAVGSAHYYTGVVCKHGHTTTRFTDNGACSACNTANSRNYARRIRDQRLAASAGMKPLTLMVHPDDVAGVKAHCAALALARGMT